MEKFKLFAGTAARDVTRLDMNTAPGAGLHEQPVVDVSPGNDVSTTDACIMMVDDEPINMEVVQAYLEDAGYSNFITTSKSTQAMQIIQAQDA